MIQEQPIHSESIIATGKSLVIQAGNKTLPFFQEYVLHNAHTPVHTKEDQSPVTEADTSTELWLREQLMHAFPDYGIIGEEFEDYNPNAQYSWIIDPIDGTRAFISGVPLYTTLLGLVETSTKTPLAGFIYAPVTGELVYAYRGEGAYFISNTHDTTPAYKVNVSPCHDISTATVLSYDFQKVFRDTPALLSFLDNANIVRTWADGYAYLMLATGRAHAVIDPHMHIWDIAPVYPILIEAGAKVATWNSNPPSSNTPQYTFDWSALDISILATSSQSLLEIIHKNMYYDT